MKIGLIGQHSEFSEVFPTIRVVDFNSILRKLSKYTSILVEISINFSLKQQIIKVFEVLYGTVAFTGGCVLTEDVIQELRLPVFVENLCKCETYQNSDLYNTWKKKLKGVCEVYENPQDLLSLSSEASKNVDFPQTAVLLQILNNYKGEMKMPSIEESIALAMAELGIDMENTADPVKPVKPDKKAVTDQPKPDKQLPAAQKKDKQSEPPKTGSTVIRPKQLSFDDLPAAPVAQEDAKTTQPVQSDAEDESTIFCKIRDGKMALIIPVGMPMQQKEIADMQVNVLSVSIPDLASTKLQVLDVFKETKKPPKQPFSTVERVPIISKKAEKTEPEDDEDAEMLEDRAALLLQKSDLDAKIKQARADGDEELINKYRKQRRAVRNKLNKI